jgi:formamidopyrimidine-DNA glycosylase
VPELPEVETMRRNIATALTGDLVASVDVRLPKLLRESPLPTLEPLVGLHVLGADRRAKVLLARFDGGLTLALHCKLAGQVAVFRADGTRLVAGHPVPDPAGPYPHKATHVEIRFASGAVLYYSDIRQFGWLRLIPDGAVPAFIDAFGFGPEAVGAGAISLEALAGALARRRIAIKTALLDQRVLAGLGNIYVDEALHVAGIHPSTPANQVGPDAMSRLYAGITWALEEGIAQGGAKIVHHKAYPVNGFPRVHARLGERCMACGAALIKVRVGQRGTYLCQVCQPLPDGVTPPPAAAASDDDGED